MTFIELAEQWLELKKMDVGNSQYNGYIYSLKRLEPLHNMAIQDIRVSDVQAVITALAKRNEHTGKPTAKKTLRDTKYTAKQILQMGVDGQMLKINVANSVKIPRNAPKDERRALTPEEQKIITDTPHKFRTVGMILLYSGLRRGEIIPLLWSDIDLDNGCITVNKAVDLSRNTAVTKCPKTAAGCRVVHIPDVLVSYLRTVQHSDGLVMEKLYSKIMWHKAWHKYMDDLGLPDVTAHMLRHTACTMMIESGMDVSSVQAQMGHADIQTTLAIYTHVTQKHRAAEVEKLNEYLKSIAS